MKKPTEGIIIEVMLWWLLFLPLSYATLCRPGQQFWNETLEKCVNCSKCPQIGHVVLRPCQIHQDTVCGPLSALDIDWSFISGSNHRRSQQDGVDSSESAVTHRTIVFSNEKEVDKKSHKKPHHKKWKHHHHKKHHHNKTSTHHHHHQHHHRMEWSSSETFPERSNSSESEDVFWERHETSSSKHRVKPEVRRRDRSNSSDTEEFFWEHHEVSSSSRRTEPRRRRPESASQLKEEETNVTLSVTPVPFSAAETLVWDWQAVALGLAVFACLLFFLVACVYSVHHARQWRRLKDHFDDFEADVGELSTRLSLLLPTLQNEANTECCNNSSQCLYLEKLLARKRQEEEGAERGNVYIDRDVATNVHRG